MVIVRFSRVWRAVLGMGHPLVRWSLQMMTQNGGMTAQLQGDHEGDRGSTTKLGGMWKFFVSSHREQGDAGGYAATGISSTSRSMSGYQRLKMALSSPFGSVPQLL